MFPKGSKKLLLVLFVIALIGVLMVGGPLHTVLHGDSPDEGCNLCNSTALCIPTPILVPVIAEVIRSAESPPAAPLIAALHGISIAPRAPPTA